MTSNRCMDKEGVAVYATECHSAVKNNAFESVLAKWMNLEPVIQSQKEENKYCLSTHVYGIEKDGAAEPICRPRWGCRDLWKHPPLGREGVGVLP